MPDSSINTGLANIPDLSGVGNKQTEFHIIQLYNAIGILQQAVDTYSGNTPSAPNNWSSTDPGSVNTIANNSKFYLTAAADITAGVLVGINAAGQAVLADKTSGVWAIGVATNAVSSGAVCEIILMGCLNLYAAGTFVKGTKYYLGDAGHFTATLPATVGDMIQPVAFAYLDTAIYLFPSIYTETVPTPSGS